MIFSASTTHALRALAWLAAQGGDQAVMGRTLARNLRLPPDYLAKILATLARNGVLVATRGVKGGYRLARAPDRIRLIDVVEPFEGRRARPGCLLQPDRPCRDSAACSAHRAWAEAKRAYTEFLEKGTLADIGAAPTAPGRGDRRDRPGKGVAAAPVRGRQRAHTASG